MTLRAAGAVGNVNTGRAVTLVAGCGWAGFVVGPVVIGSRIIDNIARGFFPIPVLTAIVAMGTAMAKGVRRSALPTGGEEADLA